MNPGELLVEVAPQLSELDYETLDAMITALLSLHRASEDLKLSLPEVAEQLARSPDLELSEDQRMLLMKRAALLAAPSAMVVTSKALDIATSDDKAFHSARTISEVRPVFLHDIAAPPVASVLVHTLTLNYHHLGRIEQVQIGLDSEDLAELRRVLDRAARKAERLNSTLSDSAIPIINYVQDDH